MGDWRKAYKNAPRLTPEERGKVLGVFTAAGGPALAARAIGKSIRHLEYCLDADPELRQQVEDAKAFPAEYAKQTIFEMATLRKEREVVVNGRKVKRQVPAGDVAALIFFLKNEAGWSDRRHISGEIKVSQFSMLVQASYQAPLPAGFEERVMRRLPKEARVALPAAGD